MRPEQALRGRALVRCLRLRTVCRSLTVVYCAGPPLNQLWVEKHKPESVAQLVGNGKLIADLRMWLNEWQRCVDRLVTLGTGDSCDVAQDAPWPRRNAQGQGGAQKGGAHQRPARHRQNQRRQNHLPSSGLRRDGGQRE